jgi:hypothetical protein
MCISGRVGSKVVWILREEMTGKWYRRMERKTDHGMEFWK